MDIYVYDKKYFKEAKEVQRAIIMAIENLYERIEEYEAQNIDFQRIYDDDKVKYDKCGEFYVYKAQKLVMQLRILYTYLKIDNVPIIVVADYVIKKKNNKKYIKYFQYANTLNPLTVYGKSRYIEIEKQEKGTNDKKNRKRIDI